MGAFDVKYLPQTSIKEQVLANLVAKFTEEVEKEDGREHGKPDKGVMTIAMTLRQWRPCKRSFMRKYVAATSRGGPYHTEPLFKGIGGSA